jgi:uncharacterized protein YabN with tetrapyrrole methylase and pyrophosphatase domain
MRNKAKLGKLKLKEGGLVLEGVPKSLPALLKHASKKVRAVGFDWEEPQVWGKVQEE